MIKIAPTTIHSGWCHRIIVYINSKYCSMSLCIDLMYTAAFTYYYDPVILQNKLTPLSIFRDPALRK